MPAQVEFHTGVADPVAFACRLLRKAWQARARVLVSAAEPTLAALDQALWTFDAQAFVPHVRVPGPDEALAPHTPIWLSPGLSPAAAAAPRPPVLLNLGGASLPAADDFERVIEVVGSGDEARQAGRERWRHYLQWGVAPRHHQGAG